MKINKTDEIENLTIFHRLGLHNRRQKCLVPFLSLDGTKIGNYFESKSHVFFLHKRSEKRLIFHRFSKVRIPIFLTKILFEKTLQIDVLLHYLAVTI